MRFSTILLTATCALALSAFSTAANASTAATISGAYANDDTGGDLWGINGAANTTFGHWGIEGDATYHDATGGGGSIWSGGGNVFWQGGDLRAAANVTYHHLNSFLGGINVTNYGVGGEWFAGDSVTLAARGGGLSGSGASGGYVGGNATWYVMPNLNINGGVDYTNFSHGLDFTTEDIGAEWMFSSDVPVSLYGGYQHFDGPIGLNANIWFVGVKLYADDVGGDLVNRQRGGTLGYIGQSPLFIDKY